MASLIENSEKELLEINAKFEDTEYLDSLSPKAEEELKIKQQALHEDLGRYQQQFYQVLNQANYQMIQKMSNNISQASEIVAKQRNLNYVINREACFYTCSDFDVTHLIVSEMDKRFDAEAKKSSDKEECSLQLNVVDETALDRAG